MKHGSTRQDSWTLSRTRRWLQPRRLATVGASSLLLGGGLFGVLSHVLPANAASFVVDTTADVALTTPTSTTCNSAGNCSLRAAIQASNNLGGNNTITLPAGTYNLSSSLGELQINPASGSSLTINGAGAATTIVHAVQPGTCTSSVPATCYRVFDVDQTTHGGVNVTLSGITVSGGRTAQFGGAGLITGPIASTSPTDNTTITNCIFSDNVIYGGVTTTPGGAISQVYGTLTVSGSTFTNNSAGVAPGGAIDLEDLGGGSQQLSISNSTFTGNSAGTGGAVKFAGTGTSPASSITGSTFTSNTSTVSGGGLDMGGTGYTLNASSLTFLGNSSATGGAIHDGGGTLNLDYSRLYNNTATTANGAVNNASATVNANTDWWGSNAGPGTGTNFTPTNWQVLTVTPSAAAILVSTTDSVTADLDHTHTGGTIAPTHHLPDGIPVTFGNGTLGTVSPGSGTLSSGSAATTYTAGATGGLDHNPSATIDGQTTTTTIEVDQPPHITSGNSATFLAGASVSCTPTLSNCFHVTAAGYPPPTFSETGALPSGVTLNSNGTLSGTPAACSGGVYPITITATNHLTATNQDATDTQSFTLTVNEAPSITSANNTTFTTNQAGTFTVTACGYPAPSINLTNGSLPGGVTYNSTTHVLSGTPVSGTGGPYSLQFTAHNTSGSDAVQAFTLTVDEPASITSGSSATFTVGTPGSFSVTTGGYPHPTLSDGGATLPGGVTFVDHGDGTATLGGTPTAGSGGTYSFIITAHNGIGTDATQSFSLTVNEAASVTSADHVTFTTGSAGTFSVTTLGYPRPSLSDGGATLPSGVTFTDNGNGSATLAGTPAAGTGGSYLFTITAHNGIGSDGTQSFTLTVDQPPAITSADHTTFTVGSAGTFTVTTNGFPPPTLSDGGATLPGGVTFSDNGDGTATLAGTPAGGTGGTYTFTITASNGVTPNGTQSFTLTVNEAPAITSADHTTFATGQAGTFSVTTTGFPSGASMSISDGGATLPSGVTFTDNGNGTATLAGTPGAGTGGTYTFTITASNGVSPNGTQSFTLTVDQPPAITSADNTTFTVGQAGTFTVTTSGFPTGASMTVTESGTLPSGVTFSDNGNGTGTLAGTPGNSTAGDYPITFGASNGVSPDASQSFTLHVLGTPNITSADHTTFVVGQVGTFTVTTTGSQPMTISDGGATLPSGVTFVDNGDGTATLSGTPGAGTAGTYSFTITAHNSVPPDATQPFTLQVNEAPAITSADNTTFTVGTAGSFNVTTTGTPTPSINDGGATLPGGVTFVDNGNGTATLSGTPAAGTGGTYSFTITAHNGVGSDATQSFTLTVNEAPTVTSANHATFTVGSAGNFSVTTNGFPAPTVSDGGAVLPSGVTFTDNGNGTATLAGTPAAGTGGTYTFTITASNGVSPDGTQGFTLTVDEAPFITSADHTTFTAGQLGSFQVTTGGFPVNSISESGALPSGVSFVDNGDGTATLSGTPATGTGGVYSLDITAHNGVGSDAHQTFTLTVNEAATFTSADHATFFVGTANSFSVTTDGYPAPSIGETGALPGGITFVDNGDGTATLSGTATTGSGGIYHLNLTAHNGIGSAGTQAFTLTVNEAAAITSANNTTFTVGSPGTFSVTTRGFPAPSLSDGGAALPGGVTFTDNGDGTATLAGTPAAGSGGTYSFTITAHNAVAPDATQGFTLTVDEAASITSADHTTFTTGQAGTFSVTSNGFPAPSLSESGALPGGVTFTDNGDGTATLSGTPNAGTGGVYHLLLTAHNGVGSDGTQNFTLTVDQPAAITSASSTTFTVGTAGSFSVTTTGFPTPSLSDGAATLPSGVTFTDNGNGTATLSGTPATGTGGVYHFTNTAHNGVGSDATQSFTLTVNEAAAITSANTVTFQVSVPGSFTVTTRGYPIPSLSETGALPSGVTFTDNGNGTATLAGTPASGTSGTYPLTLNAHNGIGADGTQAFTLIVGAAPTTTTVTATNATPSFGQSDTFTATVAPVSPATGTPQGTVTFSVDGTNTVTVTLVAGQAQWTTSTLQPGAHTIGAVYSGQANTYKPSSGTTTVTVGCAVTYTGRIAGTLSITSGSACVNAARVSGGVSISGGANVAIVNSNIGNGLTSNGAGMVSICSTSLGGSLSITNSTGFVLVGSNSDDSSMPCPGNTLGGGVTLTGNHGGLELGGNPTIKGAVVVSNNVQTGPSIDAENTAPEIEGNSMRGSLTCNGNTPAPTNDGSPNTVSGGRYGQCSAARF